MLLVVLLVVAAGWALAILVVLSLCRAAARGDEHHHCGRRLAQGATVGVVVAATAWPPASAQAACADARVAFEAAPDRARKALLCEINRARRRHDAGRLRLHDELALAARRHAADMRERRYFAHVSPGGGELGDRLRRAGYARADCSWWAGEVLAWGTGANSTAGATVAAWLDSPSHRRILISRRYHRVGIGLRAGTPFPEHPSGVTAAAVLGDRRC